MRRIAWLVAVILLIGSVPVQAGAVETAQLQVAGKSALLMDMATGTVLYENNPHARLAPASVTKVMTMLLIMEAIDSGKIGWNDMVTASETAAAKGGSQIYLKVGETMSVSDMVKSIAVSSANDCACAMAEHIAGSEEAFVALMNQRAKELGMEDTNFVNCTGLDDDADAKNHKTSAYDIALMSRELLMNHPDMFAGAVPMCSGGDPTKANIIKDIPIWAVHGALDSTVPVEGSRLMANALQAAGAKDFHYTEIPNANHDVWTYTFSNTEIFLWLFSQQKGQ